MRRGKKKRSGGGLTRGRRADVRADSIGGGLASGRGEKSGRSFSLTFIFLGVEIERTTLPLLVGITPTETCVQI
jgi:hypothetical protein